MPASHSFTLPSGVTVLERGWLSANNIVCVGPEGAAVVDTGYCTHADQTVDLVRGTLGNAPLLRILNTHLHSDHCGGNAALQAAWPGVVTSVPPGQMALVQQWDAYALSYTPTGQECTRFRVDEALRPGSCVMLAGHEWQVHAAPGHDPHSVVLFEPESATLISADALWENGFGVVFPELEGVSAFEEVAATLDLIEQLAPRTVIPGHGPIFTNATAALTTARKRLHGFAQQPLKHARYAGKVLLKYKLLELQHTPVSALQAWAMQTPYFGQLHRRHFSEVSAQEWLNSLVQDLVQSGAATLQDDTLHNA